MSKKPVYLTVLVIVLMGVLGASFNVHKVEAPYPIIYIKADGSIEPATANITSSDNVTYTFTADINASIVVEKNNTVVNGAGYTLQGVGGGTGIDLSYTNNVTLQNVIVSNFSSGIRLVESSHNTVTGSTASNNTHGIFLFDSSYNTITDNVASNNGGDGIFLTFSHNNTIAGNNVSNTTSLGIQLYSCSHNTITGNGASNNTDGIFLFDSSYNTITGNNLTTNSNAGIRLQSSSNNTISGNNITNNSWGIELESSSNNNTLTGNNVEGNPSVGIRVGGSMNNVIFGNNIVHSDNGIDIVGVLFTTISRNHIAENNQYGVILDNASNNTISANNITNNNLGIFYDGLCNNNTASHNNFIDNTKQVEVSLGDVDAWDDGVEGNYWSDYTGVDSNHDGIGDSWYNITQNNTDHYPLMGMFHSFNTSLGKSVNIISNSTVDNFQYESPSTIRFHVSNTTASQTHGFCRVSIPYEVLSEPFNVTIDGANPTYWNYTLYDNGTHRWIYFEYEHTTREIVIVPEFPSFIILPLFMIITLLAVILYRRKHST